ncbi:MAG TPA: DUF4286 family protein [Gemmatimonadales bacterium]
MIAYEVTVEVEEALVERFMQFMQTRHIPRILATGCFSHAEFNRATETRFRQRYLAGSLGELERYLERHAPALRAEYAKEFPEGTSLTREIWEELNRWKA